MNWKLRLMNPATLTSLIVAVIALIYEVLAIIGITPWITQDEVINVITEIITVIFTLLTALGIVTDPTTSGVTDSEQAMEYDKPRDDTDENA